MIVVEVWSPSIYYVRKRHLKTLFFKRNLRGPIYFFNHSNSNTSQRFIQSEPNSLMTYTITISLLYTLDFLTSLQTKKYMSTCCSQSCSKDR